MLKCKVALGKILAITPNLLHRKFTIIIIDDFRKEYGTPTEQSTDAMTGHKIKKWRTKYSYLVEVIFTPDNELSKKMINIYFTPTGVLKKELDDYNEKKKLERG